MYDINGIIKEFPALAQEVYGKPLVYLDNAATTQKPRTVIEALTRYYSLDNANVHRGVHQLSERATAAYEAVRSRMAEFINAPAAKNIVFVKGATEAINLIAQSYGRVQLKEGDEILITHLEHHANIVPWQMICEQTGAKLKVKPIKDTGEVDQDAFAALLNERTKIVSFTHVSNALGIINPAKKMIDLAHRHGAAVILDGAQAVSHLSIDVAELDCDFYVFSMHKLYGPTGIGVLYGKSEFLEKMPPYQGGGEMIRQVTFEKTTYNEVPAKFEGGTPNIAGVIASGAALDFISSIDWEAAAAHEQQVLHYALDELNKIEGLTLYGTATPKAPVISFTMANAHPHDIGTIVDREGIAIRGGHHCAMPLMNRLGAAATARASFGLYNRQEDVDKLVSALKKVGDIFR